MMAIKGWLTVTGEERPTGLGGLALVYAITEAGRAVQAQTLR
jgi:DNA-binding PadR family transcriptional regulator